MDEPQNFWGVKATTCDAQGNPAAAWPTGPAYIAGPMRRLKEFNFPAFFEAEARLIADGAEVGLNPARYDVDVLGFDYHGKTGNEDLTALGFDLRQSLSHDMEFITLHAAWVCVLPGWEQSSGASAEVATAKALGLPVVPLEPPAKAKAETILEEAQRLVYGERNADYGHPRDDFARSAAIWSALLGHPVTPHQVAMCMVGVKLSREVNRPKRDNRTDGAGYFACLERLYESK